IVTVAIGFARSKGRTISRAWPRWYGEDIPEYFWKRVMRIPTPQNFLRRIRQKRLSVSVIPSETTSPARTEGSRRLTKGLRNGIPPLRFARVGMTKRGVSPVGMTSILLRSDFLI